MSKNFTEPSKYLELLGLKTFRSAEKFWSYMERRHGEKSCQELDEAFAALSNGRPDAFYEVIYRNLDLSLDIGSMRRNLYCKVLEYFTGAFPKIEGTILDIGCGNGITTCFLASRYPSAKFIGIDKAESAVNCSRLLADRLGLQNVEFTQANCDDPEWPLQEGSFDKVLSITGLDPSKNETSKRLIDLLTWANNEGPNVQIKAMENLSRYIKPDGTFISVDRLPATEDQIMWMCGLQNAGFGIDTQSSSDFSFTDLGNTETLPVIVTNHGRKETSTTDLLSLCVERRGGMERLSVDENEALSELVFSAVNPKSFVAGWKVTYHDASGTANYEVWQSGVFILLYVLTTHGHRELKFAPSYQLNGLLKTTEKQMDSFKETAEVSRYCDEGAANARS
jgi:SAM-dependent methyltransferase